MPYIKPEDRVTLDPYINGLTDELHRRSQIGEIPSGSLTYIIYRLCEEMLEDAPYADMALVLGVLEATKAELYRRKVAPYEDGKIHENGDTVTKSKRSYR